MPKKRINHWKPKIENETIMTDKKCKVNGFEFKLREAKLSEAKLVIRNLTVKWISVSLLHFGCCCCCCFQLTYQSFKFLDRKETYIKEYFD